MADPVIREPLPPADDRDVVDRALLGRAYRRLVELGIEWTSGPAW
jgi:hypothetical protein